MIRLFATLFLSLALLQPIAARAADQGDGEPASPRAVVDIGGVSVVLIAAQGRLHAYVDRIADNAPSTDSRITITTADGRSVAMAPASEGLFVGPFDPGVRKRDTFLVSVTGPDATGEGLTEIIFASDSAIAAHAGDGMRDKLLIAVVSGLIGLVLGTMLMRRRSVGRPATRPA